MSTFGRAYRVTTYGESHGHSVGCVLDGVPAGFQIDIDLIQAQLNRRRPGQSILTTARSETDRVRIQAGLDGNNIVLGSPIAAFVCNHDMRPEDYRDSQNVSDGSSNNLGSASKPADSRTQPTEKSALASPSSIRRYGSPWYIPRPSHADYAYLCKYQIHAYSGGGRASARETIGRVIAGSVAEQVLHQMYPDLRIVAFVSTIGHRTIPDPVLHEILTQSTPTLLTRSDVDASPVRCPHAETSQFMCDLILEKKEQGDSIGGTITCVVTHCPVGLGEPCFDKLQALLAHAILSIPAVKGFSYGEGFDVAHMTGRVHNDAFVALSGEEGKPYPQLTTKTNHSGGIQGGISIGTPIVFKTAFKPPATISQAQETVRCDGQSTVLCAKGRHDPCIVPRAVPIVESMVSMVLLDCVLLQQRNCNQVPFCSLHPRAENGD